ncbi:hypothetical protein [Thalassotalea ganghwensis]
MAKSVTWLAILLGVLGIANGVFMIVSPEPWYWLVPGVPDRGPFNQHFLRDIGIIYLLNGASFILGALYTNARFAMWLMPSVWLAGHAVFHLWEVFVGICSVNSLSEDFSGVTLPALVAIGLTFHAWKEYVNDK